MLRYLVILALFALTVFLSSPGHAQLRLTSRFAVTQAEVARAIMKALDNEASFATTQVQLMTDVVATQPSPVLDITSIAPLPQHSSDQHQVAVRVACIAATVCMPFYAIVSLSPGMTLGDLTRVTPAAAPRKAAATDLKALSQLRLPVILHSGAHATLILEDGSTRLAVPVISLENAAEGQSIRVASLDRKHIYTARTVSATLLKGSF